MSTSPQLRSQLQGLKIPKEQRPGASGFDSRRVGGGKWVILLLLIALGGGGAYLARHRLKDVISASASAAEVPLHIVAARPEEWAPPVLTGTGRIVSDHKVQVTTKVSGQIVALHFEQGNRVEKGQLLAKIEDVIYRARRDEAASMLAKAKATLEYQKYNYERTTRLFQKGNAPEVEHVDSQRALREAEAQAAASQAALDFAQKALNDCDVVAPIAGVILERNVEVGDFVAAEGGRGANANAQFALIADMSKLRVEVDVSELDIARIRTDMPCEIRPDAYKDRRYSGHVMWLDPGANFSKATVQVKVRIDNPDDYLRVEGQAQVQFFAEAPTTQAEAPATRSAGTIWIPSSACTIDASGKRAKVFVAVDGRLKATQVTVARQNGGQIEVVEGLVAGQSIAAADLDKLTDGQRIRS